jgi:hypothetical protein
VVVVTGTRKKNDPGEWDGTVHVPSQDAVICNFILRLLHLLKSITLQRHNISGFSLLLKAVPICIKVQTTMPRNISSEVLRVSQYLQFKFKLKRNERIPNNKVMGISDLTT